MQATTAMPTRESRVRTGLATAAPAPNRPAIVNRIGIPTPLAIETPLAIGKPLAIGNRHPSVMTGGRRTLTAAVIAAVIAVPTVDQIETAATVMIAGDAATAATGTRRGKDLETAEVVVDP
ncbi:MAG TPA: hypothetical protein VMO47_00765, partial [Rhodothermales bacterium]|nr:hypothetical protein [Rhodothermales bacterium]